MRRLVNAAIGLVVMAAMPAAAGATIFTLSFVGVVDDVFGFGTPAVVGDPLSGSVTYDDSIPGVADVTGTRFTFAGAGGVSATLPNSTTAPIGTDAVYDSLAGTFQFGAPLMASNSVLTFQLSRVGPFNAGFPTVAELQAAPARYVYSLIGSSVIAGPVQVTRISAAVPEPATWAAMVAGFGLIGVGLRRRRGVGRSALVPAGIPQPSA